MERAIESCKVRMASEEKKLEADKDMDEDKVVAAKRKISNVKEIVADMEQRVRMPSFPVEEFSGFEASNLLTIIL
jgi:HAT1-interacting factor 1